MSQDNPYAAPAALPAAPLAPPIAGQVAPIGVWRQGKYLVFHKSAKLPEACIKTNQPSDGYPVKRKLYWHTQWIYILLLFGLIGMIAYVIVAMIIRQTATVNFHLSSRWRAVRVRRIAIAWIGALSSIAVMVGAFFVFSARSDWRPITLMAGLFSFLGFLIYTAIAVPIVRPARITADYVKISGVHRDYLAQLPEWPYAGLI